MKYLVTLLFIMLALTGLTQFAPGNIVVYRVGDGSISLVSTSAAVPVFLDEYTPSGTLVQSVSMPTAASGSNKILTGGSNFSTGGWLTRSVTGRYLILTGYNAPVGTSGIPFSNANERVVGVVDYNESINTSTAPAGWAINGAANAAVSTNGTDLWLVSSLGSGPSSGVLYTTIGATSFTQLNSDNPRALRYANISGGQLYVTSSSVVRARIGKIGTGLPKTGGQTFTGLPGLPTTRSTYQFVLADLNATVSGVDVAYAADDTVGIIKYSLVGGNWVSNGIVGSDADDYRGLTADVSGSTVTLYATRKGNNGVGGGGELIKVIDPSGYNGAFTGSPAVIASVPIPDYYSFIGVAMAPVLPAACAAPPTPSVINITPVSATINWDASSGAVGYEYALTTSTTPPASGTATTITSYNATGLLPGTQYYFHVRTNCGSFNFSQWATAAFVPNCQAIQSIEINNMGNYEKLSWKSVIGVSVYEYAITTNINPPASGMVTTDTSISITGLFPITRYYIHVRVNCGSGNMSSWMTKSFVTSCYSPQPTIGNITIDQATIIWNKIPNASGYDYAITSYPTPPMSGVAITDTFFSVKTIKQGATYYFHVRAHCVTGAKSEWSTVNFHTIGMELFPNPGKDVVNIRINGQGNTPGQIVIVDAMGRIVLRQTMNGPSIGINIDRLTAGVYFIKYEGRSNKFMTRFLKQ